MGNMLSDNSFMSPRSNATSSESMRLLGPGDYITSETEQFDGKRWWRVKASLVGFPVFHGEHGRFREPKA